MTCCFLVLTQFLILFSIDLKVMLDSKFQNQTCGLCGNFNGINDEFTQSGEHTKKGGSVVHGFSNLKKGL